MRRAPVLLLAIGLSGCRLLSGPPSSSRSVGSNSGSAHATATSAQVAQAERTHEYPAPAPPAETASTGASLGAAAIRRFAEGYINWTAATVGRRMEVLALASIGQARSAMALAAAQTANDYELRHGGIANHGVVEAVAPLPGRRDEFVVVTREQTTATNTAAYTGLRPAWHVTVAGVTEVAPRQWVVSRWQPES